jgi:hypothetical protein
MTATRIDPDYLYPTNEDGAAQGLPAFYAEVIAAINEHADGIDNAGAGDGVSVATFGAQGDGTTPDQVAINNALAAADADPSQTLFFPPGEYLITAEIPVAYDQVKLRGRNATIRYASTVRRGFVFASGLSRMVVDGLSFQGDNNDDYAVNQYGALYFDGTNTDVDVQRCAFQQCTPIAFTSGSSGTGRLNFEGNRVLNSPNAISGPSYTSIKTNWFVNDAIVDTRSHGVYLYGPASGCDISGNWFINIAGNGIQLRAGSARYQQKRNFTINGNHFVNSYTYGVWVGSDDRTNFGSVVINANTFHNAASCIILQGCRDVVASNNVARWDFEYSGPRSIGSSAITVMHGGVDLTGHINPSTGVRISNNHLIQRHPFFATVTFASNPTAGETITVGSQTYTWVAGVAGAGQIQIQADAVTSTGEFVECLRGRKATAQNTVLRDETDAFHNEYITNGAPNNVAVIASYSTFTLSEASTSMTVSAVTDNRDSCQYPITGICSEYPSINNNTIVDFLGRMYFTSCDHPDIKNNTLIGTGMQGDGNAFSKWHGNTFIRTATSDAAGVYAHRVLFCSDGFADIDPSQFLGEQESTNFELGGVAGVTSISDGKERCFLFYGAEQGTTQLEPMSLPFRWNDGDTIEFRATGKANLDLTFKRSGPGATEFNSASDLVTKINASADWRAAFAPVSTIGGGANPNYMIELKLAAAGSVPDARVYVTTRSKTCGQVLRNWYDGEAYARFKGGGAVPCANTFVFTHRASETNPLFVRGADFGSHGLDPRAYKADVVPGVGYLVTHTAGTGTLWWRVGGA